MENDSDLIYARFGRGWLLANTDQVNSSAIHEEIASWKQYRLGDYVLFVEPLVAYHCAKRKAVSVHAIGVMIDVLNFDLADDGICESLAVALESMGWSAFYSRIKSVAGAYVIIIEYNGVHVMLDAAGTVPAAYGVAKDQTTVLASHPRIVASLTGSAISSVATEWAGHPALTRGGAYMPGLLTEFEGVEIITPNQRFEMESRRMIRFYPDGDLPELEPRDIAEKVVPLLSGQLVQLTKNKSLAFSLSGGLDTRVTLAASFPVAQESLYFTYFTQTGILANDLAVATRLRDKFSLNHISFSLNTRIPETLKVSMLHCEGMLRATGTNYQIASHIGTKLHVRSNTAEVARGFYLKNPANIPNVFNSRKLSRLFRNATVDQFHPHFDSFVAKTNFYPDRLFNLHYSDIFYWEHRLPGNYGAIYRSGRPYFETYMIYNCRLILEWMLSTSIENRRNAKVMFEIMKIAWPEVLEVPIFSGSKYIDINVL